MRTRHCYVLPGIIILALFVLAVQCNAAFVRDGDPDTIVGMWHTMKCLPTEMFIRVEPAYLE